MKNRLFILFVSALVVFQLAQTENCLASNRSVHKFGVDVGILSEPFPSLMGLNASYNIIDYLRVTAGYGSVSGTGWSFTTLAGDVKLFPLDWNFAPFGVIGYTNVTFKGAGSGLGSVTASGNALYYGLGFDWQTARGFNLGFEYKMTTIASNSVGLPGFYVGWFF